MEQAPNGDKFIEDNTAPNNSDKRRGDFLHAHHDEDPYGHHRPFEPHKHYDPYDDDDRSPPLTISQPTPPHSTDSSAPLSPLSTDLKNTSLDQEQSTSETNNLNSASSELLENNILPSFCDNLVLSEKHSPCKDKSIHENSLLESTKTEQEFNTSVSSSLLPESKMGCSIPIQHQLTVLCSAPQPNDTPPPTNPSNSDGHYGNLSSITDEFYMDNFLGPVHELTGSNSFPAATETGNKLVRINNKNVVNTSPVKASKSGLSGGPSLSVDTDVSAVLKSVAVQQLRLWKRHRLLKRRIRHCSSKALSYVSSSRLQSLHEHASAVIKDNNSLEKVCDEESKSTVDDGDYNIFRTDCSQPNKNVCLPEATRQEADKLAEELSAAGRLYSSYDPEATESSSGGESCDELEGYDDSQEKPSVPM